MKILLLLEADSATEVARQVRSGIEALAAAGGCTVTTVEVRRDEVPPCLGCLACMTRHPGICVHQRAFESILAQSGDCDVAVFLTAVVFGTFGSAMKNLIDRGGLIIRNHRRCRQIFIGYGAEVTEEERRTFLDLTAAHRGKADIVHLNVRESIEVYFAGSKAEADSICRNIESGAA